MVSPGRIFVVPACLIALLAPTAAWSGPSTDPSADHAAGSSAPATSSAAAPTASAVTAPPAARQRGVRFGAYVQGMQEDPAVFTAFEGLVGRRMDIASYYYGYGDVFPGATELALSDGGRRDVLLSWDMGRTRFTSWTRGRHDGYLRTIARAARAYPYDVYVRPWPEMNGDWQPFQPTKSGHRPRGGTYEEFRKAWRHVVTYVRHHGGRNVKWVFNPTADTYAQTTPVEKIWPGKRYVDVLGLDGFNWGHDRHGMRWRSFRSIFHEQYRRLVRLDRRAPVWVCEFGSKEPEQADGAPVDSRHSKAAWLTRALRLAGMPRVRALVYFHADKERDWRLDSSPDVLAAARQVLPRLG